jgi:fatty acid desaturase
VLLPVARIAPVNHVSTTSSRSRFRLIGSTPCSAANSRHRNFANVLRHLIAPLHGGSLGDNRVPAWSFARINLVYQGFWIAAFAAVGVFDVTWLLVSLAAPYLLAIVGSGVRLYVEHAGTDEKPGRIARSFSAPFWTVVFFGNNLHLEHHLYPNVPCYRLPELHAWLKRQGFFERNASYIETGNAAVFKYAGAHYPYPSGDDRIAAEPAMLPATGA